MQSVELRISNRVDLAKRNGKGAEAAAIIADNRGTQMESKLAALDVLTKPFTESWQESAGSGVKNMLVESFKANFDMSQEQAEIAAGVRQSRKNNPDMFDLKA
jgi:hypothetical protein